jgi:hypothetical protein
MIDIARIEFKTARGTHDTASQLARPGMRAVTAIAIMFGMLSLASFAIAAFGFYKLVPSIDYCMNHADTCLDLSRRSECLVHLQKFLPPARHQLHMVQRQRFRWCPTNQHVHRCRNSSSGPRPWIGSLSPGRRDRGRTSEGATSLQLADCLVVRSISPRGRNSRHTQGPPRRAGGGESEPSGFRTFWKPPNDRRFNKTR